MKWFLSDGNTVRRSWWPQECREKSEGEEKSLYFIGISWIFKQEFFIEIVQFGQNVSNKLYWLIVIMEIWALWGYSVSGADLLTWNFYANCCRAFTSNKCVPFKWAFQYLNFLVLNQIEIRFWTIRFSHEMDWPSA